MSPALPASQAPAFYRRRIGDWVVTVLSDGWTGVVTPQTIANRDESEIAQAMARAGNPLPFCNPVNAILLQSAGRTVLVDAGSGRLMDESCGRLPETMAAADVAPEAVDAILMTHLHSDHMGGLLDADGRPAFAGAELFVPRGEADFWFDEANAARLPERSRYRFPRGLACTAPYGERLRVFDAGEPVPGIEAVAMPGHTPGHTGYRIGRGNEALLIWGDLIHVQELQIPQPDVHFQFDLDAEQDMATRRRILDEAAREGCLVTGMHMHLPGFGRILREDGGGHVFQSVTWSRDL